MGVVIVPGVWHVLKEGSADHMDEVHNGPIAISHCRFVFKAAKLIDEKPDHEVDMQQLVV